MYSEGFKRFCTVFGSGLLMFPTGIHWYWGNLATYILSYLNSRDASVKGTASAWVISILLISRTISTIASGSMIRYLGIRITTVLGIAIFNIGLCGSYLALQHSMALLNFTLGCLCGFGAGIVYGTSLEYLVPWGEGNLGLVVSIVQSSYNIGAIILNQFVTLYINPNNHLPDIQFRDYVLFSNMSILKRVPYIFIILTTFSLIVQVIGVCIVREKDEKNLPDHDFTSDHLSAAEIEMSAVSSSRVADSDANTQSSDLGLLSVFQTASFYLLSFIAFLNDLPYLVVTNYYKIFGQIFIKDDHFLSTLGTVNAFAVVVAKTGFGYLFDIFTFKTVMISIYSLMAIATAFIYVTASISQWLYSLDIFLLSCTSSVSLIATTVVAVKLYGRNNVAFNSGVIYFAGTLMDFLAPPVMEVIVNGSGWLTLFYGVAVTSVICFLLVAVFLPRI